MNNVLPNISRLRCLTSHLPFDFAIGMLFNVAVAVVVTYVMHMGGGFWENLVFSMCVGSLALVFIDSGRLILWRLNFPPVLPFLALAMVSIPIAKYFGNMMAMSILGLSAENASAHMLRTKNPVEFLIMTFVISAVVTWFFWTRAKLSTLTADAETEKARAAAIEKQAMQAQLQLLQAQIEPHMLFNTLANLQGMIAIDPTRAQHMLDQLILYLRATLSSSRAEKSPLSHEFSLMDAYLGLMSVRMGARLSYTLRLPPALQDVQVLPMLLQPLVENAIKHGLESKIDGGRIEVSATEQQGMLTLAVADTGHGLDDAYDPEQSSGAHDTHIGLANVRERLQAMYGARAALTLAPNTPSGVIARLTIPMPS